MPILGPPTFEQLAYQREENSLGLVREMWMWEGKLHSVDDHPSVIIDNGSEKQWHSYGMRHRIGGPAWTKEFGLTELYYNLDMLHRTDGPAMISNTNQKWYFNNKVHRADGPAVIHNNGRVEWWWRGRQYLDIDEWFNHSGIDPELFTLLKLEYG